MKTAKIKVLLDMEIMVDGSETNQEISIKASAQVASMINSFENRHIIRQYSVSIASVYDNTSVVLVAIANMNTTTDAEVLVPFEGALEECELIQKAFDRRMSMLDYEETQRCYLHYSHLKESENNRYRLKFLTEGYGNLDQVRMLELVKEELNNDLGSDDEGISDLYERK